MGNQLCFSMATFKFKKKKKATTTRSITNLETAAQKTGKEEKAMEGGRRGLIFRQST